MKRMGKKLIWRATGLVACGYLVACEAIEKPEREVSEDGTRASSGTPDDFGDSVDINFLSTMTYVDAASMASQSMELPPYFRVAAENITHPRLGQGEELTEFTATGNVYLEVDFADPVSALCQEAAVNMQEVVLRGRPVLRRGQSIIEATSLEQLNN